MLFRPHIFLQVVCNVWKSDFFGITLRSSNIVENGDDYGSFVIVQVWPWQSVCWRHIMKSGVVM